MPWLLVSPGHQQPWYCLCRIHKSLSYLRKDFYYLCRINVEEWHKIQLYVYVPSENLACKGLILLSPWPVACCPECRSPWHSGTRFHRLRCDWLHRPTHSSRTLCAPTPTAVRHLVTKHKSIQVRIELENSVLSGYISKAIGQISPDWAWLTHWPLGDMAVIWKL